ncbi:hypothetical protein OO007_05285 [Cocleimonas sp. KMM 6892]|uniref:hypothetical protein n=1 Tax=unclassified Cocleimonas TaxID=2639732 RepID=UPI002DB9B525|nr:MULTISPECIES: hypothetical protein [unclassified Cocleimonas]MEB8431632.1 hypothetical protein [Cocleimonas sp. KMM 6892]MEC4713596.1 hypothetical protein [Cocleimonas sp. KMM 6895]MEC4742927.1 hypothetical protein [Cocleimonas sp. KMM 6896]
MNYLIKLSLVLCLCVSAPATYALSDSFYSTGEDLDFLMESQSTYVIEEIEYELRQFILYRKIEDLFSDPTDEYSGILGN